jgi:small subunit ribosomal protein S1
MIRSVDKERGRICLSTKLLEQEAGEMLSNRQLVYDEAEARAAAYRERQSSREKDR